LKSGAQERGASGTLKKTSSVEGLLGQNSRGEFHGKKRKAQVNSIIGACQRGDITRRKTLKMRDLSAP